MSTIGMDELPLATREVLDRVRAEGEALEITDGEAVVARLVPVPPAQPVRAGLEADLDAIDELAAEVSAAWQGEMTAVDAVREQRREV